MAPLTACLLSSSIALLALVHGTVHAEAVPDIAATLEPLSMADRAAVREAKAVAQAIHDAEAEQQRSRAEVRRRFAVKAAQAKERRDAALRQVPGFWYTVLTGIVRHDSFMTSRPHGRHAAPPAFTTVDGHTVIHPSVAEAKARRHARLSDDSDAARSERQPLEVDDHYLLRRYLTRLRCLHVHAQPRPDVAQLERHAGQTVPPDAVDIGEPGPGQEQAYRLELEFRSNPYFTTRRLFKQVPVAHAFIMYDPAHADGRPHGVGVGNSIRWVGDAMPAWSRRHPGSFFALFDPAVFRDADTAGRHRLYARLSALVRHVCSSVERAPLEMFDQAVGEREAHDHLTELQFAGHDDDL